MSAVFSISYTIWFLFEFILSRVRRSSDNDQKGADKSSLAIIWIVVVAAIALASYVKAVVAVPIHTQGWIAIAGLGLLLVGIIVRICIVVSLGKYFTVDVTIRKDHQLKQDGFYSLVRHPSYTASWLTFVGFGLSLNNWISLLIVAVASLCTFLYRIKVEEDALIKAFGTQYLEYKSRTKALIPFIY